MMLIDGEKLIKDLEAMKEFGFTAIELDGMIKRIREQDTIEVGGIETKAGWKKKIEDGFFRYICSECGGIPLNSIYGYEELSEYCPHCGAKMEYVEGEGNE